jgi:multicomponent Na+:H+ antiporter subunit F
VTAVVFVLVVGALAPCTLAVLRGGLLERLAAVEAMSAVATVVILTYAQAVGRTSYVDVALVLALLSFAGSLVFARFFGRAL